MERYRLFPERNVDYKQSTCKTNSINRSSQTLFGRTVNVNLELK